MDAMSTPITTAGAGATKGASPLQDASPIPYPEPDPTPTAPVANDASLPQDASTSPYPQPDPMPAVAVAKDASLSQGDHPPPYPEPGPKIFSTHQSGAGFPVHTAPKAKDIEMGQTPEPPNNGKGLSKLQSRLHWDTKKVGWKTLATSIEKARKSHGESETSNKTCQATDDDDYWAGVAVCVCLCGCAILLVILAIWLAALVIGSISVHKKTCPLNHMIPIYLVVYSSVCPCICCSFGDHAVNKVIGCFVSVFLLAWHIAGAVWIFHGSLSSKEGDKNYCEMSVYATAAFISVFSLVCLAVYFCGVVGMRAARTPEVGSDLATVPDSEASAVGQNGGSGSAE